MLQILLVIFLLLMNAFFVAAEFALVRVRVSQLEGLKNEGNRRATQVLKILEKIDAYLSAVQLGVTIASLGLGWLVEPAINHYLEMFFAWLALPISETLSHGISAFIAFFIASFLHIVIGEITPKSVAIAKPLEVAMFVALPMRIFHAVFNPVMLLLVLASTGILKLFHITPVSGDHSAGVSAEELRIIAQHSSSDGTITKEQGTLLDNVFNFSALSAKEIMVPRGNVVAMPADRSLDEFLMDALKSGHSRYPVYGANLDDIIGVVHIKDVIRALHLADPGCMTSGEFPAANANTPSLESLARKVVNIPETATIANVMETLQQKRLHMAIVVDEYGGTSGILTIEDAVEKLVGNIEDEFDPVPQENIIRQENGWLVNGATLLGDLCETLKLDEPDVESTTVAGFIMEKLGSVAKEGDAIEFNDYRFCVEKMDKLRIDKVFIHLLTKDSTPELKAGNHE